MRCEECKNLYADYCAGELPATVQQRFAAHLAACPECRLDMGEWETVIRLSRKLPVDPLPEQTWTAPCREPACGRPHLLAPRLAAGGALVALITLLSVSLLHDGPPSFRNRQGRRAATEIPQIAPDEQLVTLVDRMNEDDTHLILDSLLAK